MTLALALTAASQRCEPYHSASDLLNVKRRSSVHSASIQAYPSTNRFVTLMPRPASRASPAITRPLPAPTLQHDQLMRGTMYLWMTVPMGYRIPTSPPKETPGLNCTPAEYPSFACPENRGGPQVLDTES